MTKDELAKELNVKPNIIALMRVNGMQYNIINGDIDYALEKAIEWLKIDKKEGK